MSKMQREKGARGEKEVEAVFRHEGFLVRRTPNSGGLNQPADLNDEAGGLGIHLGGADFLHVETKRQETIKIGAWLRQAYGDRPPMHTPLVAFRTNKTPGDPVGDWHGVVPLAWLASILAELRDYRKDTR